MPSSLPELTALLKAAHRGDKHAEERAYAVVYDSLEKIARIQRRKSKQHETLDTQALVHEAYMKLVRLQKEEWADRNHFFAVAATAMRQILLNDARNRLRLKRGGDRQRVEIHESLISTDEIAEELLALNEALKKLEKTNERLVHIVECRFFAGLTIQQTADILGISTATVNRDYRQALDWLFAELGEPDTLSSFRQRF